MRLVTILLALMPIAAPANHASEGAPATGSWHTLATEAYPKKRDDLVFVP